MHSHAGTVLGSPSPRPAARLVSGGRGGGGVHIDRAVLEKLPKEDPRAGRARLPWSRSAESHWPPVDGADALCPRGCPPANSRGLAK